MGGGGGNSSDTSQIFSATLNIQYAGLMSAAILVFTMAWSFGTRYMESKLLTKPHYLEMLSKAYRELMILGFLSITLVLLLEFHTLEKMHISHAQIMVFEFAHLMLFAVALVYISISVLAAIRLRMLERRWTRTANMDVDQICELLQAELDTEAEKDPEGAQKNAKGWWSFGPLWSTVLPITDNKWDDVEWKLLRLLFLKEFRLGLDFDYSQYMHRKLIQTLLHSLHIKPSTWGMILIMCLIHHVITFEEVLGSKAVTSPATTIAFSVFLGWALLGIQGAVLFVLKSRVHRHILDSGCDNAAQIPRFLRVLDGHIVARDQVRWLPMFQDAGKEFLDRLSTYLDVSFAMKDANIFTEGDAGDSMFFICKGSAVVICEVTKQMLGEIGPGDYAGEMSILLDEPRSKTIKAQDTCVIGELSKAKLKELEEEFPQAIQTMRDFAMSRKLQSGFDDQSAVAGQTKASNGLQSLLTPRDPAATAKPSGAHGEEGAEDGGDGAEGGEKKKPSKHEHLHGMRSANADNILSHATEHMLHTVSDFLLLATCFHFSYYCLHLAAFAIPYQDYTVPPLIHAAIILPSFLQVYFIRPATTRYFCLVTNAISKDNDMIAVVVHSMDKVIALRNQIKRTLMESGMKRNKDLEFSNAGELAKFVFHCLDDDASGELDYDELKEGLPMFDVYLTADEFKIITRFMDPDQDKSISIQEWSDFMMATEEELSHGGWQENVVLEKLQGELRAILQLSADTDTEEVQKRVEAFFESVPGTMVNGRIKIPRLVKALNAVPNSFTKVELGDFERAANAMDEDNKSDMAVSSMVQFLTENLADKADEAEAAAAAEGGELVVVDTENSVNPLNQ